MLRSIASCAERRGADVVMMGRIRTRCRRPVRPNHLRQRLLTSKSSHSSLSHSNESLALQLQRILGEEGSSTSSGANPVSSSNSLETWIDTLTSSQRKRLAERLSSSSSSSNRSTSSVPKSTSSTSPSTTSTSNTGPEPPEPSFQQLRLVALNNMIPFIGFGFMDNAILIVAGDAIDTSLGVLLGISTMCAAAIGNIVSDVAGIMLGTAIEDLVAQLNLPTANLTAAQRQLRSVRLANQAGCAIGIVVGCIIGMFPLLFIDSNRIQARKREKNLDAMFRDVVTEAGSLVGAANVCLFVRVDQQHEHGNKTKSRSVVPTANGKYLYAKYDDMSRRANKSDRLVPLGKGIVSRAALTGEPWKIDNVQNEPDYHESEHQQDTHSMLCVPVLDAQGCTIAVLQAINKVGKGLHDEDRNSDPWIATSTPRSFTNQDVQILKALASHIGVSLQRIYEKDGDDEMRLRDTIRMLKDYGLAGLGTGEDGGRGGSSSFSSTSRRPPLFPED